MAVHPTRRASKRLEVRVLPEDLVAIRQLARMRRMSVTQYVTQAALGQLQVGRDRVGELEARLKRVERQLEQAHRGY